MSSRQKGDGVNTSAQRIWLKLQAEEVVELKQLLMDRDVEGVRTFFHRVVAPRVRRAAERRGISTDAGSTETEKSFEGRRG